MATRRSLPPTLWLLAALALLGGALQAAQFSLPSGSGKAVWEAEAALHDGWARSEHPQASGGAYASTQGSTTAGTLEFAFEASKPTTLRVWPTWWRDGVRTYARRFPYPLAAQPGPDVVAECGGVIFFTAPVNGRVGLIDPAREKLVGSIDVGGYLTDIVADSSAKKVFVADGLRHRVVMIDVLKHRAVTEVATPEEPWSLALWRRVLFVACRAGKCVVPIDLRTGKPGDPIALPAPPIHVEVQEKPQPRLVVWFSPHAFDAFTCAELAPDEQQYPGSASHTSLKPNPTTTYDSPAPGVVRLSVAGQATNVDVSSVTTKPGLRFGRCGNLLFFTAADAGRIGVIDTEKNVLVKAIEVGGRPADLIGDTARGKVYVADEGGSRVVVVGARELAVVKEVPVPDGPVALELVTTVTLQRAALEPPLAVNKVFVVCARGKAFAAIDALTDRVVAEAKLPADGAQVRLAPVPNDGWWPLLPLDRIPIALQPKVAVDLAPVAIPLAEKGTAEKGTVPFSAFTPRNTVQIADGRTFTADNQLLLGVTDPHRSAAPGALQPPPPTTRWIDVTSVADPQTAPVRPLAKGDQPGAVTLSVDGGPEYDWLNDRWMTPDNQTFLVAGSSEFRRWNAPTFRLDRGKHVLKVRGHSAHAGLDSLLVEGALDERLHLRVLPEPREVHGPVPLPGYQGVFYDQEPVRFTVEVTNAGPKPVVVGLSYQLRDYMGAPPPIGPHDPEPRSVGAGKTVALPLEYPLKETGRYTLTVEASTFEGSTSEVVRFVRLPRLVHPRLFLRREELPAIRQRIAKYPNLYRRYAEWLARQVLKDAPYWPERFLPPGLTRKACGTAAPPEVKGDAVREMRYGWRMYDLGWRMFACEFMANFADYAEGKVLADKMAPLLNAEASDYYVEFHHHGPFFPGAAAALYDMAPDGERARMKLGQIFDGRKDSMDAMPEMMVAMEEPLTPDKRALVYKIMQFANNRDLYFETHMGSRAGTWWQSPWTGCHCPMHGLALSFLFTRNFFGEDRYFEKPLVRSILTFNRYVDPISDKRRLLPALDTPNGEPWRWLHGALARHPLEQSNYEWDQWIAKLEGPAPEPREEEWADRLFALEGMPNTGPLGGGVRHFVTGVSVPIGLALGWYDPAADKVTESELPPTTLFDFEGWAAMKSGWDAQATEVSFMCGARDHTNRQQPTHFTVVKAGDFLLGTPALYGDDGNCTPSWGNVVVVGDDWVTQWRRNLSYPRDRERLIINRFSPMTFAYIDRDRRLFGFKPAEGGWGGGLDLHGHTETPLWAQGQLLAYETRPAYDYVAGDATNAWPADEVAEMLRQLVFLKPDVVVVYDRVRLADSRRDLPTRWVATTAPKLAARADGFRAGGGAVAVQGKILLPEAAAASKVTPYPNFMWKDQELLEVRPPGPSNAVEYLVVLQTGTDQVPPPDAKLVRSEGLVGAEVKLGADTATVVFRREGVVGGEVASGDGVRVRLPERIVDTYEHWRADPRFRAWMTEKRFNFVISADDRRRFGSG